MDSQSNELGNTLKLSETDISTSKKSSLNSHDIPGKLTSIIGSGKHAQNTIVYQTIVWSFLVGGMISGLILLEMAFRGEHGVLKEIKEIWSLFIPVITLALGYVFGKDQ